MFKYRKVQLVLILPSISRLCEENQISRRSKLLQLELNYPFTLINN